MVSSAGARERLQIGAGKFRQPVRKRQLLGFGGFLTRDLHNAFDDLVYPLAVMHDDIRHPAVRSGEIL